MSLQHPRSQHEARVAASLESLDDTTTYLLRHIPDDLWARFKTRSEEDGIPMRALLLKLIEWYADGKINIGARKS